jgi:lipopolysaccharide export system protein LptA
MRLRVCAALWLAASFLVSFGPAIKAQGLPNNLTVTSGNPPVDEANQTITTSGAVTVSTGSSLVSRRGVA